MTNYVSFVCSVSLLPAFPGYTFGQKFSFERKQQHIKKKEKFYSFRLSAGTSLQEILLHNSCASGFGYFSLFGMSL